ncbi:MAG: rRNA maturation RNase YbeY [Paludibacteraceae bacterium]|jgi:rRNA maturation RNase YbeY|nr:rRNA maturation RNase YbeY [Paludibacteraceae bacterium]
MITFTPDNISMPPLNLPQVERWIRAVAAQYGFSVGELNYIFCDDEKILAVNREFLQHDYYTDVITFDYTTRTRVNGDIYISLDTVATNAEQVGATFEQELHRIIIHGLLHLTGQADKTPETKAQMTAKEEDALSKITLLH